MFLTFFKLWRYYKINMSVCSTDIKTSNFHLCGCIIPFRWVLISYNIPKHMLCALKVWIKKLACWQSEYFLLVKLLSFYLFPWFSYRIIFSAHRMSDVFHFILSWFHSIDIHKCQVGRSWSKCWSGLHVGSFLDAVRGSMSTNQFHLHQM